MASVDAISTVEQTALSGLPANPFADEATSDNGGASESGTGNAASAEARSFGFSNEFLDSILQAGNYGTADVVKDREERIAAEIVEDQPPEAAQAMAAAASPEVTPDASTDMAPAMLAERLQDAPQPALAQGGASFGALLAGAGICLSSQVIGTCEHIPDSHAMELTPASVAAVGQDTAIGLG